jgi:hypothetical protein
VGGLGRAHNAIAMLPPKLTELGDDRMQEKAMAFRQLIL